MKSTFCIIRRLAEILLLNALLLCSCSEEEYLDYVNPNIGTVHSRWFVYTPASEPFGMAKLGASTNGTYGNRSGWEAVGYEDAHSSIDGFPCFHEFQIGGVALMPVVGDVKTQPGKLENPQSGWRSNFQKANETAKPGYYSVLLDDYNTKVELTATTRVGFQRFTFPESDASHILFNIGNRQGESGRVLDASVSYENGIVKGFVVTEPAYVRKYQQGAKLPMYFYAVLDKKPDSVSAFYQGEELLEQDSISGPGSVLCLNYKTFDGEKVNVKLGLSLTSIENAELNLNAEAGNLHFDAAHRSAVRKWREQINRIAVKGGSQEDRIKFYTGLYHVLLGRGVASDVNGAYPKNDGTVGQIPLDKNGKPQYCHYNTDAVWGAYWDLTPLWALAYPEYYRDFISSQLLVYSDAGWLGDGIASSRYVSGVGTNMVSIAIAGAYNSGIRGFDVDKAYEAARKNELGYEGRIAGAGKMDVGQFVKNGYVAYGEGNELNKEASPFAASHTLEYSFSAYAVAQMAKQLGKEDDYKQLMELSKGWEKLYDEEIDFIRPRGEDGEFLENFNPYESWRGFQEGNAMQYTFFVPQDPEGLIAKMGREEFNHRLDSIFIMARESVFGGGKTVNAFSGLQSPYNHGNQPSLHIPWLFNFSGRPDLTQKWTRLICDEFYGSDGLHGYGYGQDEDQGQLGAWYVISAMGLFDVQGGACERPTFQLGSPKFDRIEIKLSPLNAKGKKFVIITSGNSADSYYVKSAKFNGQSLDRCWLYRDEIFEGGVLELEMSAEPSQTWSGSVPPVS